MIISNGVVTVDDTLDLLLMSLWLGLTLNVKMEKPH